MCLQNERRVLELRTTFGKFDASLNDKYIYRGPRNRSVKMFDVQLVLYATRYDSSFVIINNFENFRYSQ